MSREIYNKISSIKWGYLVKLFLIIIYSYPNQLDIYSPHLTQPPKALIFSKHAR